MFRQKYGYTLGFTLLFLALLAPAVLAYTGQVDQLAHGQWRSNIRPIPGQHYMMRWDANVWVDVAVQDLAYNKQVGIRWTTNNWQTYTTTPAAYEQELSGNYEQWGVNLTPALVMEGCQYCIPYTRELQYAVYYTVNSQTYWDNNNGQNYKIQLSSVYP